MRKKPTKKEELEMLKLDKVIYQGVARMLIGKLVEFNEWLKKHGVPKAKKEFKKVIEIIGDK